MLKCKLILLALCLCVVGVSLVHEDGFTKGIKSVDDEAFNAQVAIAQNLKAYKQAQHKPAKVSIWSALDKK